MLVRTQNRDSIEKIKCATAHYWARELLAIGHEVKLMPPTYVKPYIKCGKT
jgi:transposase